MENNSHLSYTLCQTPSGQIVTLQTIISGEASIMLLGLVGCTGHAEQNLLCI
jgi:hypothetical protein